MAIVAVHSRSCAPVTAHAQTPPSKSALHTCARGCEYSTHSAGRSRGIVGGYSGPLHRVTHGAVFGYSRGPPGGTRGMREGYSQGRVSGTVLPSYSQEPPGDSKGTPRVLAAHSKGTRRGTHRRVGRDAQRDDRRRVRAKRADAPAVLTGTHRVLTGYSRVHRVLKGTRGVA